MSRIPILITTALMVILAASCVTQRNQMEQNRKQASLTPASTQQSTTPAAVDTAGSFVGRWEGAIVAAGQNIPIRLNFTLEGGSLTGTIDIPGQAAEGLPLIDLTAAPPHITFALNAGSDKAHFDGRLSGNRISGRFEQGPATGTFAVTRAASGETQPSTASTTGEGSPIELGTPTGTLSGSLVLPSGRGPFPVALIIAGSGPTDRNGNSPLINGKNDSLLMIAQALQAAGIASVRYDKRGIAESAAATGKESDLRFSTYIDDAASWIELLKHDPRFTKVAVIGHSEGSLIGMIAARTAGADAYVSVAGAGFPAGEILKTQLASQPEAIRTEADSIIASLEAGNEVKSVSDALMPLFRPSVQPYLISWFRYDPRKEIARLTIPVLILQGTTDLQVSVKDAEALHAAQPRSTLDIIPGMNHVLKLAPENRQENLATYGNPKLPLAPLFVKELTGFLKSVL